MMKMKEFQNKSEKKEGIICENCGGAIIYTVFKYTPKEGKYRGKTLILCEKCYNIRWNIDKTK